MNYKEIIIKLVDDDQEVMEVIMAHLELHGFESFVEMGDVLKAYIIETGYQDEFKDKLPHQYKGKIENIIVKELKEKNWNELWEKSFEPVIISEHCVIKAPFHHLDKQFEHEILIEPKMSFGTGHHATTFLVMEELLSMNCEDLEVLDLGTGTGVLAILAFQKHAKKITAVDIDKYAIENCQENFSKNNCKNIKVIQGDISHVSGEYNLILANINRNILLDYLPLLNSKLKDGGTLILSGILIEDYMAINVVAQKEELLLEKKKEKNNWLMLKYKK